MEYLNTLVFRMESAVNRLKVYADNSNAENQQRIELFISKKMAKKASLVAMIETIRAKIPQVEDVVSKSSPEMGMDPQMEPLVTSFVSTVEDGYTVINEQILDIKDFEFKLLGDVDLQKILSSTDSALVQVSQMLPDAQKNNSLKQAKSLQENAYKAYTAQNNQKAAKLTSEAYYLSINILPGEQNFTEDIRASLIEINDRITTLSELVQNAQTQEKLDEAEFLRLKTLVGLSEEHILSANDLFNSNDMKSAKKELTISNFLVTQLTEIVKKLHGHE